MKHRPKHVLEYGCLRALAGVARILPYRLALLWGAAHAALAFYGFRFRRREVERRIRMVLGESLSARDIRRVAWQSWRNVVLSMVELLRLRPDDPRSRPPHVDFGHAMELAREHVKTGRGAIFACPHFGNWEMAGILVPTHDIPMFTVTGVLKNPLVQDYVQRIRKSADVELIPRGARAVREIATKLKAGKILAIMPDVRSRHPGVLVDFLGGQANVYPGMAAFAHRANVPIFLGIMKRDGWTRHRIETYGPFEPDMDQPRDEDVARLAQDVFTQIDKVLRDDPGQWFWYNKRWILDPVERRTVDGGQ